MQGGRHFSKQHIQLVESNTQTSVPISHCENTDFFLLTLFLKITSSFRGGDRWKARRHFDTNHTSPHTLTFFFFLPFADRRIETQPLGAIQVNSITSFHKLEPSMPASLNNDNVPLLSSLDRLIRFTCIGTPDNLPIIHHPTDLSGLGFGFGLALAHEWAET